MKTITLNLIKKNRIWIDCTNTQGYKCKLKMSDLTKNLELGEQAILAEDVSIRSKYGIDLRYEILSVDTSKIFLKAGYNKFLVKKCRELGGVWEQENKIWVFSAFLRDKIDDLEEIFGSEIVTVEITANDTISCCCDTVDFLGYTIAIATSRDSGARLSVDVSMLSGKIDSSGSVKNWDTVVAEKSTFRLSISKNVLENYSTTEWSYKILD